jgi:hypothetical protein
VFFRRADDDAWQWIAGGGEGSEAAAQAARRGRRAGRHVVLSVADRRLEWRWVDHDEAMRLLRYDGNRTALFELAERLRRHDLPEPD